MNNYLEAALLEAIHTGDWSYYEKLKEQTEDPNCKLYRLGVH